MVRRKGLDEAPVRRVRIAVFRHPRSAGQQVAVALHVQQRHLHHHRAEQLGVLHEHVAGEQAAVAAALDAEVRGRCDLACDQILRHSREILVRLVPVGLERGLVPARTVLAAAADVGDRIHAALLQPALADATGVARRHRDLEAAVAIKQGRRLAVHGQGLRSDQEVGNPGAVLGGGEVLLHRVGRGIEERRVRLQDFRLLADLDDRQRGRRQVIGDRHPQRIRGVVIDRTDANVADRRRADERTRRPPGRAGREHAQAVLDVFHHVEHEVVLGPGVTGQRGLLGGLEQHAEVALAGHEVVEAGGDQRAGRVGLAACLVRGAKLQQQPVLVHGLAGRIGRIDLGKLAVLAPQVQLVVVEGDGAADEIALVARRVVAAGGDVHVARLAGVDRGRAGQRGATVPLLDDVRVAGAGHRARAEIGEYVHAVFVDPAQPALGLGTEEAVLDPGLAGQVELAGHVGIGAAARQRDQAAPVGRLQAIRAVPNPVLAFCLVQCIEVEHGFPLGLGLAVLVQRGAAPQAPLVLLVLPEVVVEIADLLHAGDLCVGVEDGEDVRLKPLELGGAGKFGFGLGIARAYPVQRLVRANVFQPGIGIIAASVTRRSLRRGAGGKGEPCHQAGVGKMGHAALRVES